MKNTKSVKRPKVDNSRKAIRKQKRQQKKLHRQEHYMKKKTVQEQTKYVPGRFVKRPADDAELDRDVKKKKQKPQQTPAQDILIRQREKERNEANRLKSQMEEQRKKIFFEANEDEDKIIKKLEKQLGLKKTKNKNNFFADDGLDYLLEICDRSTTEQIVAAEKHLAEVDGDSDFEEDLAAVTGKELEKGPNMKKDKLNDETSSESGLDEEENDDDSDDDEHSDVDDGSDVTDDEPEEKTTKTQKAPNVTKNKILEKKFETQEKKADKKSTPTSSTAKIITEDDLSKVFSEDEVSHLSDDGFSDDEINEKNDGIDNISEKPDVWEDIYGRKRDKEGNVIKEEKGVYIPPHLRNKDSSSNKEMAQLKRQIKSVLNKLAGTNLHWACTSIENLYSNNSRNSVNTALTELWLDATVGPSNTPDRMVAEHAALVSVLHANVGSEIGAHFLQELSQRFDEMTLKPQPVGDKTLANLVSCLAHLYCFKIYHASLLYDILGRLLDEISEKSVECVLVALRSVGGALRKDDPLALKSFINDTQGKIAKLNDSADSGSRIKYLLDVLMAVKNNNLSKIPNYDPSYTEHLRKMTRSVVRKGNYITPLNIRLEDLLKVDERGKWWVVGSAWEGNRTRQEDEPPVNPPPSKDQKLLELARKQRMNTDVRRSIFCVIMSAEDFMDAFEKLQHLGLKGQQEREIVHVLLACCLQEKTYNPYYSVLGQKLCDFDRKYQLSIQYSVWDKIKDLENVPKQCMTNMAQFLIHLIMEKCLPLSVLKVIQFSELNKHSVRFMRQILLTIIMNEDLQTSLEAFHRISKPPKLHMFRESIRLFIRHFLLKNTGRKNSILSEDDMATLKDRAMEVDKILTLHESKLKF